MAYSYMNQNPFYGGAAADVVNNQELARLMQLLQPKAPVAAPASPQAMAQPQQQGLLGAFSQVMNSPMFHMGLGLLSNRGQLSGLQQGMQNYQAQQQAEMQRQLFMAQMANAQREQDKEAEKQEAIQQMAERYGIDPALLSAAPRVAGKMLERKLIPQDKQPYTLAAGSRLIDENGNLIAAAPFKPESEPQVVRTLEAAGLKKGTPEFNRAVIQAITKPQVVLKDGGVNLSPAQKKMDEQAVTILGPYLLGGAADTEKLVDQLTQAEETLRSGDAVTGPFIGLVPDAVMAFANPSTINTRDQVEEAVQRNLRVVLGAQFAQKEGEMLIKRAFNPSLDEKINAERVSRLITQIKKAHLDKMDAAKYLRENKTLAGWEGRMPSMQDFVDAVDGWTIEKVE